MVELPAMPPMMQTLIFASQVELTSIVESKPKAVNGNIPGSVCKKYYSFDANESQGSQAVHLTIRR